MPGFELASHETTLLEASTQTTELQPLVPGGGRSLSEYLLEMCKLLLFLDPPSPYRIIKVKQNTNSPKTVNTTGIG